MDFFMDNKSAKSIGCQYWNLLSTFYKERSVSIAAAPGEIPGEIPGVAPPLQANATCDYVCINGCQYILNDKMTTY